MTEWRLAEFVEDRELGRGAQGRVVLARHQTSPTPVAIKYLNRGDRRAVEGLRAEAQMLGRLTSPYVVRLYRFVEGEQGAAIVMEAVNGVSLKTVLTEHGALTPEAALIVLKGSLLGLAAAHSVGVVHRDYKPANVMVRGDGLSKLVDFGVAVLAGEGSAVGTPAYMAPEQWRGEPASPATDVYAATCVFVECVTGHRPFVAGERLALMNQHLSAEVDVSDIPAPLRSLVTRGMAKDAGERPPGAAAFVAELESAAVAAYGIDWEQQGVRALAAGAVALAALFPLGAMTIGSSAAAGSSVAAGSGVAASGSGAAAGSSGSATAAAAGGKGLLATAAGKGTLAVAGTAVVASTAGVGYYATQDSTEKKPAPIANVTLASQNERIAGTPIVLQNAQYFKVSGLDDPALERRINTTLHSPIDDLLRGVRSSGSLQYCQGTPYIASTKATAGLRGPRLVSVRYELTSDNCQKADGHPGGEVVTIDLKTGKRLTATDVFLPATLTPQGLGKLKNAVEQPADEQPRWDQHCSQGNGEFKREDFFPRPGTGVAAGRAAMSAFFTPSVFRLSYIVGGSDGCRIQNFEAPYEKVRPLLQPSVVALLPKSPSPTRT
ncbi:serine/threonine-protein kinase [Spirillospora sp. CA-294931]|uniref:serine/threonine-protein kinase n=1 Tax=Spirillospora sp. CA-294931 TaxID=3240042 RepID=UPI003D8A6596